MAILEARGGPFTLENHGHLIEPKAQALAQRGDELPYGHMHDVAKGGGRAGPAPDSPHLAEEVFLRALLIRLDGRDAQLQGFEHRRTVALGPGTNARIDA